MRGERSTKIPYQRQNTNVPYQQIHNREHVERLIKKADPYVAHMLRLLVDSHNVLAREILRNTSEWNAKRRQ